MMNIPFFLMPKKKIFITSARILKHNEQIKKHTLVLKCKKKYIYFKKIKKSITKN